MQPNDDWASHFRAVSRREKTLRNRRPPDAVIFGWEPSFGADISQDTYKQVQSKLNQLGANPPLVVDGVWGPKSAAALKLLQTANNITVDGIVGPQVLGLLGIKASAPTAAVYTTTPGKPIPGLRQATVDFFPSFTTKLEGYTPYMYTDSKGLVTTGIGNLIDSGSGSAPASALSLPWKKPDGSLASQSEIAAAWSTVKNAYPGVQSTAAQSLTNLRLDKDGIAKLVNTTMANNHNILSTYFPNYGNWPAEAQLALHSLSWAWGPAFYKVWNGLGKGPLGDQFRTALNQAIPDFNAAAAIMSQASQHEESINAGIRPRDAQNTTLFANAATLWSGKGNFDSISFPNPVQIAAATTAVLGFGFITWAVSAVVALVGVGVVQHHKKTGKWL